MFNFPQTPITQLFKTTHPIVQAGMVWVSGARLAAAAAESGCLGVLGAGSMKPEILKSQLEKLNRLTSRPVAVNIPLLYPQVEEQISLALKAGIRIFITSAGSPKKWTAHLKSEGCVVVHVTSHPELALKCEKAGVDAVIVEGFEAGGHNGREELTTLVLLQQCRGLLSIPVIAAGGIGTGHAVAAAFALGADGVQIGSRFAATQESSAHENFKKKICEAGWSETQLQMKPLVPVRLLNNHFAEEVREQERHCASREELATLLGKGRAKKGMLEGDLEEGELEIGQIVSQIKDLPPFEDCLKRIQQEYHDSLSNLFSSTRCPS